MKLLIGEPVELHDDMKLDAIANDDGTHVVGNIMFPGDLVHHPIGQAIVPATRDWSGEALWRAI